VVDHDPGRTVRRVELGQDDDGRRLDRPAAVDDVLVGDEVAEGLGQRVDGLDVGRLVEDEPEGAVVGVLEHDDHRSLEVGIHQGRGGDQQAPLAKARPETRRRPWRRRRAEENALFAWLPSITPISRQAAYSGKVPRYFAETLDRTDKDESGWRQFWIDHALSPAEIAFVDVHGNGNDLAQIDDIITPQTRALGVTLFKVDKIMHGMQLGAVGMAEQVKTWGELGFFINLLNHLQSLGFDVFISADHGNTEAVGIGNPKEGVLSDKGGERCRIYSDPALTKACLDKFPAVLRWANDGLPENLTTLLAPHGKAFVKEDSILICHGGPSLEEVCVPFLRLKAGTTGTPS